MIHPNLHRKPVALDRALHRDLKLDAGYRDLSAFAGLNSFFVAGSEFADVSRELPIVWVGAGKDEQGVDQVAPIAVFGIEAGQNLCIHEGRWRTRYVPMALRIYPFALARVDADRLVLAVDEGWQGLGPERGQPLFDAEGQPSELTQQVQRTLEALEADVERTRLVGRLLLEHNLLREMRFDATLPDGRTVAVDGFMTIDQEKLVAMPDADVVSMHRNGVLGLIHAHQISLGNMTRLAEWHAEAVAAKAPGDTAAAAPAANPQA